MIDSIKESDWKYLKKIKPVMLERACTMINKEAAFLLENRDKMDQYHLFLALDKHYDDKNDMIADCFDDYRRSNAKRKILNLLHYGIMSDAEFQGFSEVTKEFIENTGGYIRKVDAQIEIAKPPEVALRAFTDVEAMCQWWGADSGLVEDHEGGVWALNWGVSGNKMEYAATAVIKRWLPREILELENYVYFNPEKGIFGPMTLTVLVEPKGSGTLLKVRQSGYREGSNWDWLYNVVLDAWPMVLKSVKEYVEKNEE